MNKKYAMSERWTIGNKAILLVYVILISSIIESRADAWHVLACLLYIILNLARSIVTRDLLKLSCSILSIALVTICANYFNPVFFLLLPINLYELIRRYTKKVLFAALGMFIPIVIMPFSFMPLFILSTVLSLMIHAGSEVLANKLQHLEQNNESMREELQRLTRKINESSEYFRQSESMIKLEERNKLSQRIHDDVGHAMAGAIIQMEAARRTLTQDPTKAQELLGNAISISKDGLERIRLTLKEFKPRSEELGINRLRLFIDELMAKETISATLTHEGDLDVITPIQWQIIQNNATEAVTNTLKYANATAIHIEIRVLNKFIKSVVADNGTGTSKVIKGLGILGMEERAATVGGTVIVDGTKGFSVTTLLPYHRT